MGFISIISEETNKRRMHFSSLSYPENCNCGRGSYPFSRGNGERVPPTSEEPCLQYSLENRKDGTSKAPSGFFISAGMWETELLGIVKSQLLLPNELRRIYCKKRWYWGSVLFVFKDLVLNLAGQIFCRVWLFLQNLIQSPLKSGQISP